MTKKRIKILTRGPIRAKNFINGPVLTPYFEEIANIFTMVSQGVHVVEVCDDRTEVRLTIDNINEDNSKTAREEKSHLLQQTKVEESEKVEEVKKVEEVTEEVAEAAVEPVEEKVVEPNDIVTEEKVEDVKEEPVAPQQKPYEKSYNNQYNNKHNKHNNYNKNNNYKKENQIRVESPTGDQIKIGE